MDDFCRCTPFEFKTTYDAWLDREEATKRREWEIGRFAATAALTPYSKKRLLPTDVCKFSWDKKDKGAVPKGTSSYERMREVMER